MDTIFELNIALIPEANLASKHIAISQEMATQHPALVQLDDVQPRLALPPHLTLYQVPVTADKLAAALQVLADIARDLETPALQATRYAYNKDEASFELQYQTTDQLLAWQNAVINSLNPLRNGLLLERDPAGHVMRELLQADGVLGDNLRQTGYGEVGDPRNGGLFRPHVTLNWFALGTDIDESIEHLPALDTLHGTYPMLGVYLLGPHGTCPQRIAQYACKPSASLSQL